MQTAAHGKRWRLRARKAILLFLFFPVMSLSAQTLSLRVKNATLVQIFKEVEQKTPLRFTYATEALENTRTVSLDLRNESLETVLARIFEGQPLTYTRDGNFVLVRLKEAVTVPAKVEKGSRITGNVQNEAGEPVNGATVQVKQSTKATATNSRGDFALEDVEPGDVLSVSSVGYVTKEVSVSGRTVFSIQLSIAVNKLDETVVIAYGTTTKRLNTGSVSKVSAQEIGRQPVSNPLAALSGRVPGLVITQGNGLPGSNFNVLIRGRNSIQNGTAPLYIVDGVPFLNNNDRLTQRSSLNANNPFNTLSPGDIESIEVLKDADATAIYGSRGANGVILITTKKPKAGQTGVDVQLYSGIGRPTRSLTFMNTAQYLQMRREAFKNDGVVPDAANAPDLLLWDTTRYVNWKKVLTGENAHLTNASLNFSGGNSSTRFSINSNYYRETTVFPGNFGNRRGAVDVALNHKSSDKKFEISFTAGYASDKSILPLQNLGQYLNLPPNAMAVYDANGGINWTEGAAYFVNPVALLRQTYEGTTNRLTANAGFQYRPAAGLLIRANVGYNDVRFDERSLTPISSQNPANNPKGEASFGNNLVQSWVIEPQAEYTHTVGKNGSLDVLTGFTLHRVRNYSTLVRGTNYSNDALLRSTAGAGTITANNAESFYRYTGFFARLNYTYDKKYLVNLTGRRDGSSRFGPRNQFANFGALGLGWIFSKEQWLSSSLPGLSFGKIRGSYGITGSDQINNYQYLDTWSATQYTYGSEPGFRPSRLFNPDYSWEQIQKLEAAVDLGFAQDRILLSADWYRNTSDNQIIGYALPTQTGFNTVLRNFPGRVLNKGWEFEATVIPVQKNNLNWTLSFTGTVPHNELLAFPGLATSSYATKYIVGKPLNLLIGYYYLGVNPQTGIYQFEDLNKNGKIDFDNSDYRYGGTTDPVYYGGLQNTVRYKEWEFTLFLEYRKQKGLDPIASSGALNGDLLNQPTGVLQRWQKPGDVTDRQRYTQNYNGPLYAAAYFLSLSDATLTDASFLRLKNATVSYNLPERLLRKTHLRKGRIFFQGQNLLTLTSYKGSDPENQSIVGLPPLQVLTAGIQITF